TGKGFQMGDAGVGDLAATQIEQAQLLGTSQMREACVSDLRVEQCQVRQLWYLADTCHSIIGDAGVALQVERLEFLQPDQLGQASVCDSRFEQCQVFELIE